jgi:thioredoxin reductase (NADPH)
MTSEHLTADVLVIGAGPAGLTAATYLGRFLRSVIVIDGGEPRAGWIPVSHNMPGFPVGVSGPALLERLRAQALEYGCEILSGRASELTLAGEGFSVRVGEQRVSARAVLLATGVVDRVPGLAGVDDAIRRSLVRICPVCDGYEARGRSVAIIGRDDAGVREAAFLTTFTDCVTLIHTGAPEALTERTALAHLGVALIEAPLEAVHLDRNRVRALVWGGRETAFDLVYSALGTIPSNDLALGLSAAAGEDGRLIVDDHGRTSVPGLYAAGDVVRGLNQIAVATAEAAIASTAIHNHLREREGRTV